MRIAILVLAADDPVYESLISMGIRKTWGSIKHSNIDIYYYYGNRSSNEIAGDIINTNVKEGFFEIGQKTINAFKLINAMGVYDYVFRTNTSSYVNQDLLYERLYDAPRKEFYSGLIGHHQGTYRFASGSGYSLSKDLVKYVINHESQWNHNQWDDVAMTEMLSHIPIVPAIRYDFITMKSLYNIEKLFVKGYHYRCKFDDDRSIDLLTMYKIHELTIKKNEK